MFDFRSSLVHLRQILAVPFQAQVEYLPTSIKRHHPQGCRIFAPSSSLVLSCLLPIHAPHQAEKAVAFNWWNVNPATGLMVFPLGSDCVFLWGGRVISYKFYIQ